MSAAKGKRAGNPTGVREDLASDVERNERLSVRRDYKGMAIVIGSISDYRRFASLVVLVADVGLFTLAAFKTGEAQYIAILSGVFILITLIGITAYLEIRGHDSPMLPDAVAESLGARTFAALSPYMNLDRESFSEAMVVFEQEMNDQAPKLSRQQRSIQRAFVASFVRQSRGFRLLK
jgi:hypothetical protein